MLVIVILFPHQVSTLTTEADRLKDIHKDQAGQIEEKQTEIAENWQKLKTKVRVHLDICLTLSNLAA